MCRDVAWGDLCDISLYDRGLWKVDAVKVLEVFFEFRCEDTFTPPLTAQGLGESHLVLRINQYIYNPYCSYYKICTKIHFFCYVSKI